MKINFIYGSYLRGINSDIYLCGVYQEKDKILFRVLGTSSFVYSIVIEEKGNIKCSCPLFQGMRYNVPCKHIFCLLFRFFPIFKIWKASNKPIYLNRNRNTYSLVNTSDDILSCKLNSIEIILLKKMIKKNYLKMLDNNLYENDKYYLDILSNPEKIHSVYFNGNGECSICLTEVNEEIKCPQCKTVFHDDCISQWIQINPSCPLCRYPMKKLLDYKIAQNSQYNYIKKN